MADARILVGDCRDTLRSLPDGLVHCVVTSPPYYNLRDYGTAEWEGGDPDCDHRAPPRGGGHAASTLGPNHDGLGPDNAAWTDSKRNHQFRDVCGKCGARRIDRQLGLEPTPDEYVAAMVGVFREVRRVLRDDGVLFLNLGDSYAGSWKNQGRKDERGTQRPINGPMLQSFSGHPAPESNAGQVPPGLKPKDLIGIPWRVAFALQADGWYLRSDIIWAKKNCMPESVRDRPTKAHEYLFLLSKSERYFYDADAIAEPGAEPDRQRNDRFGGASWEGRQQHSEGGTSNGHATRNARSVWTITTQAYSGAHFATFPEELARRCIVAGTSQRGCCPECGAPWERIVERGESSWDRRKADGDPIRYGLNGNAAPLSRSLSDPNDRAAGGFGVPASRETTGWRPTCDHDAEPVPCTVLDPFAGSGTVGAVAVGNGRAAILCELNPEYIDLATRRIGPMFVTVADGSRSA